jgi:uncharacterized membrane protein
MVSLIILNIILIIVLVFLLIYLFRNKKNINTKDDCEKNESVNHNQNNKNDCERVFVGKFITDEEYQQMMKFKRSDISILLEEVDNEYEHLKDLINERTEGNNKR